MENLSLVSNKVVQEVLNDHPEFVSLKHVIINHPHGVDVYLTPSPIYDGLLATPAFREHVAPMHAELRAWAATNPRLHYVNEFQAFPKKAMQSTDHLIHDAAQVYTRRLAEIVR